MDKEYYDYCLYGTTDAEVQQAKDDNIDIVSIIKDAINTDDENDSAALLNMYINSNPIERAIMDAMLVCICGYTMSSLIYIHYK